MTDSPAAVAEVPLRRSTRFFYGLGGVALGLKDNGFSYLLLIYYNQVVGLPAAKVGLAIMIALVIDAMIDPLIGQLSDNLHSRWGRRHPFMYLSAIPVAVTYLMIWMPPSGWSENALFAYLVFTALLVRTFLAMFEIPSAALAPELTSDYHGRTKLMAFRALFIWYGALIMTLLTFQVFLKPSAEYATAQLNPAGYTLYGVTSAAVMLIVILASALGTHREIPRLRKPPVRALSVGQTFREIFEAVTNRSLAPLMISGIFNAMSYGLTVALNLYFNTFFWGLGAAQISFFVFAQFISSAAAVTLATPLSKALGKRNAAILSKVLAFGIGTAPIVLRLLGLFPENGHPALLPLLWVQAMVSVTFASIAAVLHSSMIADVVEETEVKNGRRSEGLFFAANIFVAKAVSGVGIFASSMVLLAIGFPDNAKPGEVGEDVIRNLGLTYIPALAATYLVAIGALTFFRITRASHEANLARLAERPGG